MTSFTHRTATLADAPRLAAVMEAAILDLQAGFLTAAQVAASRLMMGLDTTLITDGTYFVIEAGSEVAGCGGWSRRATMYGGDHSPGRDTALLRPGQDAARVRAMYTAPAFARRGVGRLILDLCHAAAQEEGFDRVELVASLAGEPLYRVAGYTPIERFEDDRGAVPVPLVRMGRRLP
jgi:GNAT superfamily N-acetyltransferase